MYLRLLDLLEDGQEKFLGEEKGTGAKRQVNYPLNEPALMKTDVQKQ